MFKKLNNKISNMNWKDWLMSGLWSFTLIVLIAFVAMASTMDKGGKKNGAQDGFTITAKKDTFKVKAIAPEAKKTAANGLVTPAVDKVEVRDLTNSESITISGGTTAVEQAYISKISAPTIGKDNLGKQTFVFKASYDVAAQKPATTDVKDIAAVKALNDAADIAAKQAYLDAFNDATFKVGDLLLTKGTYVLSNIVASYSKVDDADSKTFADSMAAVATLFTISIFGALGSTVGIKFVERRNEKRGAK